MDCAKAISQHKGGPASSVAMLSNHVANQFDLQATFWGEFHPYTPQKTNIAPKMMVSNRNRLVQWSIFRCKTLVFEGVYQQYQQYLPSPFCSCWWHASRNGQILQLFFWQIAVPWGPSYPTKNQQTACFNSIVGQSWRQTSYTFDYFASSIEKC